MRRNRRFPLRLVLNQRILCIFVKSCVAVAGLLTCTLIIVHQIDPPHVCDSNKAEAECRIGGGEPPSNRQGSRACQITVMWDKIIMSLQSNLPATNCSWSFGKNKGQWRLDGSRSRAVKVAAGHTDTLTKTLIHTSFCSAPWGST